MLVVDHDRAGGYWGAVYVFGALTGLRVIIDGPVGCENLPVTAVLHYTDALPPHELPVSVTGLGEDALSMSGTEEALRRAAACGQDGRPAVVVTGSIAEMIGGGVAPEGSNLLRFVPRTIDEDQWQCADRALFWLWSQFGTARAKGTVVRRAGAAAPGAADARTPARKRVNLIGAVHGTFNMPSDLAEIRRLVEGIGAEVNLVYPLGSHLDDTPRLGEADASICLYREFGAALCEELGKPWFHAPFGVFSTTAFLRSLGEVLGLDPEPFIAREKETTLRPIWDLWRSVTQDFFATGSFGVAATETYARGIRRYLEDELGIPCVLAVERRPGEKPDNEATRRALHKTPPAVMFGSNNERIYVAEARGRTIHIAASFPGAVIRRATGTPFMGYAGATWIMQEYCNALFDALFAMLPLGSELDRVEATPAPHRAELAWDAEASDLLERHLARSPFLVRISAASELRAVVERRARGASARRVTAELVRQSLDLTPEAAV